MFVRVLLIVLAVQKCVDFVGSMSPRLVNLAWGMMGVEPVAFDALSMIGIRLWGCASLVWAILLFRGYFDEKYRTLAVEASIAGFLGVGLVGLLCPLPNESFTFAFRAGGAFLLLEAVLLAVVRIKSAQSPPPAGQSDGSNQVEREDPPDRKPGQE